MSTPNKLISFDAEQSFLGSCLLESDTITNNAGITPAHFHSQPHRMIFTAMRALNARGDDIDLITMQDELESADQLARIGGFAYLVEIAKNVPSAANADTYAAILNRLFDQRKAYALAQRAAVLAAKGELDISGHITELLTLLNTPDGSECDGKAVALAAIDELEKAVSGEFHGVRYGIKAMDEATGGAHNSDMIVIAAKPGMGKTAMMISLIANAMDAGAPVGFVSAEMPRGQIGVRLGCNAGRVSASAARKGTMDDSDWARLNTGLGLLNTGTLMIMDTSAPSISEVEAAARKWVIRHGIKALYIDYIQRIKGSNPKAERWAQVAEVTQRLKTLARELDIPVICLAQLNRGDAQRGEKRPQIGDIANSSEIEKEADQIMTLYRPHRDDDSQPEHLAEVNFQKNRHGPTGVISVAWNGSSMRFYDATVTDGGLWQ